MSRVSGSRASPSTTIGSEAAPSSCASSRADESQFLSYATGLSSLVHTIYGSLRDEQLPWTTDFLDAAEFSSPRTVREAFTRLNLNVPFYVANYAVLFYTVTLPALLLYDPIFFALLCVSATLVHTVHLREQRKAKCGGKIRIGGVSVLYQHIVDAHLVALFILFFFFDGFRTLCFVLLLSAALIVPHAVMRRPTYFDDEELEKLRPKLLQLLLSLVVLVLAYLECKGAGHLQARRPTRKRRTPR